MLEPIRPFQFQWTRVRMALNTSRIKHDCLKQQAEAKAVYSNKKVNGLLFGWWMRVGFFMRMNMNYMCGNGYRDNIVSFIQTNPLDSLNHWRWMYLKCKGSTHMHKHQYAYISMWRSILSAQLNRRFFCPHENGRKSFLLFRNHSASQAHERQCIGEMRIYQEIQAKQHNSSCDELK